MSAILSPEQAESIRDSFHALNVARTAIFRAGKLTNMEDEAAKLTPELGKALVKMCRVFGVQFLEHGGEPEWAKTANQTVFGGRLIGG